MFKIKLFRFNWKNIIIIKSKMKTKLYSGVALVTPEF